LKRFADQHLSIAAYSWDKGLKTVPEMPGSIFIHDGFDEIHQNLKDIV
jgi:hypothetical protein